jgi:sulfate permease, SulP family
MNLMADTPGTDENSLEGSAATHSILSALPILQWLRSYKKTEFRHDFLAGLTHAAYSVPEALVNSSLAGLAPQHGLYSFLTGGLFYSVFTTSRHAAVASTSTLSIMVGYSLGTMGMNDPTRYAEMAACTAILVGLISLAAWLLRLSDIVSFISETILDGFKVGAALVIAASQLPKLLGIPSSGQNFFGQVYHVFQNLGDTNLVVLAVGLGALILLLLGERIVLKGIVPLAVVSLSIVAMSVTNLSEYGVKATGTIPEGFPRFDLPRLSLSDIEEILPVAFGCFLLAYIEGISMIRTFASKHHYAINPRQELLASGAANLAVGLSQGFPVAVGLSQSIVNEQAGAKTPLANFFACFACALVLLYIAGLFSNLPDPVLAAMVLMASKSLANIPNLSHLMRVSKREFIVALVTLVGVLTFGILKGVLLAAVVSLLMLVHRVAHPSVSILGRIPGTTEFGRIDRHPENETVPGVLACRVEGDLLYFNEESILEEILDHVRAGAPSIELVVFDFSTTNHVDLAGARMVQRLHQELSAQEIKLRLVGAHGNVRDLLRLEGLEILVGHIDRRLSLDTIMNQEEWEAEEPQVLGH